MAIAHVSIAYISSVSHTQRVFSCVEYKIVYYNGDQIWPYVLLARDNRTLVPAIINGSVDPTISDFRDNSGRKACADIERVVFLGG